MKGKRREGVSEKREEGDIEDGRETVRIVGETVKVEERRE